MITSADILTEIQAAQMGFASGDGRLVDNTDTWSDGSLVAIGIRCNIEFCQTVAAVANRHAMTAAAIVAVLRTAIDTGDNTAWLLLLNT